VPRFLLAAASLVFIVSSCGGSAATTTVTAPEAEFPSVVVDRWLDALVAGDFAAANAVVEPVGAAVILAVENNWTMIETAALADTGLQGDLLESYWSSFRQSFGSLSSQRLDELTVGRSTEVTVDEVAYAAVAVSTPSAETVVMTRRRSNGTWEIDMVGTIGPAFVTLLRERAALIEDDAASERLLEAYRTVIVPSLRASAQIDSSNRSLAAELARLEAVLREVA
jgi:hypothetical protein